jgi:hypothetical protein
MENIDTPPTKTPWLFGPLANYNDRATAACWRILVPTFLDRGRRVVRATDSHGR